MNDAIAYSTVDLLSHENDGLKRELVEKQEALETSVYLINSKVAESIRLRDALRQIVAYGWFGVKCYRDTLCCCPYCVATRALKEASHEL
jgi:hypothetical protein